MDRTRLVGRDGELALLREQFGRARRGEARIVFVRGEAGIGKTSLAAAAVSEAPDFTLLKAAGEESEQDLAYGVVDQLFGHLGGGPAAGAGPTPLAVGAAFLRALSDAQARAPLPSSSTTSNGLTGRPSTRSRSHCAGCRRTKSAPSCAFAVPPSRP
jgi:hypothetical protein